MMSERNKGILCIIAAAFCFSLMAVFIRLAGDLPSMEKVLFRNIVASAVAWIMLVKSGEKIRFNKYEFRDLFLRASFGTVGMFCNFYAIDNLNISDANMLNKLSPFFAIIMSIILLKEKPRKIEWISVIIAFIGALFVIKPGLSMSAGPACIGFIGGMAAGIAYTFVRRLGQHGVKGPMIVMFFSTFSTIVSIPFFIIYYQPMSVMQLVYMLLAGLAATGGQFGITAAYTHAPAKEISIFDYTQVIFAAVWGMILFAQSPDALSIIGYVVIIGAAVLKYVWNRKTTGKIKTETIENQSNKENT